MFERLRKKWKVGGLQLALIITTFAIGGSLTGYAGKKIMNVLAIQQDWLWAIVYILLITILWPLAVLLVSIPFGQFRFFTKYIRKIGEKVGIVKQSEASSQQSTVHSRQSGINIQDKPLTHHASRITSRNSRPANIVLFASGAGTNAQNIINYFRGSTLAKIVVIACNNPDAGVLKIAQKENIPILFIEKEKFFRGNGYVDELKQYQPDLIVLAGFLWKLPAVLLKAYPNRIINIHPALLPKYGGKGMYGSAVHRAVIAAGEKTSGISIHYVDEHYDNGDIIFQATCPVLPDDTAEALAQRVHQLEYEYYPRVVEKLIN